MSRFGSVDPFYVAMARAMADDRMRRVLAVKVSYGNCGHDEPPPPVIVDHDPGDEDLPTPPGTGPEQGEK